MSQSPPPASLRPDQVVEVKDDPARDTQLPQQQESQDTKQAHMMAAGLAAITAAQILKREEEADAAASPAPASRHNSDTRPGASLPAVVLAWALLLILGLGGITAMAAIIYAMLFG